MRRYERVERSTWLAPCDIEMKFDGARFFASVSSLPGVVASGFDYRSVVLEIRCQVFEAIRRLVGQGEFAPFPMLFTPAEKILRRHGNRKRAPVNG
jgi:hypothetical protein